MAIQPFLYPGDHSYNSEGILIGHPQCPRDIRLYIFGFLLGHTLVACSKVKKEWRRLIMTTPHLLRRVNQAWGIALARTQLPVDCSLTLLELARKGDLHSEQVEKIESDVQSMREVLPDATQKMLIDNYLKPELAKTTVQDIKDANLRNLALLGLVEAEATLHLPHAIADARLIDNPELHALALMAIAKIADAPLPHTTFRKKMTIVGFCHMLYASQKFRIAALKTSLQLVRQHVCDSIRLELVDIEMACNSPQAEKTALLIENPDMRALALFKTSKEKNLLILNEIKTTLLSLHPPYDRCLTPLEKWYQPLVLFELVKLEAAFDLNQAKETAEFLEEGLQAKALAEIVKVEALINLPEAKKTATILMSFGRPKDLASALIALTDIRVRIPECESPHLISR